MQTPQMFMTDDSAAEKQALREVWPVRQLLCFFHVAQAEWRWIHCHITQENRQYLMKLFQAVSSFYIMLFLTLSNYT